MCAVTDGRCPNGCETWYISDVCKTLIGMYETSLHNIILYSWQVDVRSKGPAYTNTFILTDVHGEAELVNCVTVLGFRSD